MRLHAAVLVSVQKLYYVEESHGIVVTDVAFLPNTLKGNALKGSGHEAAMLSVAVDSRCQLHTVRNRSKHRPISLEKKNMP